MMIARILSAAFAGLLLAAATGAVAKVSTVRAAAAPQTFRTPDHLLYGAAYYDEYSPYERLDADVAMMTAAHINVVRIGESTWATLEPRPGVFDFTSIDRTLRAMGKAHISVIVGTPTYAIPPWLAKAHPAMLANTPRGRAGYGVRQNMDLTDPDYRAAAERMIRMLVAHVKDNPAVIGYQLDNETKHFDVTGPRVQAAFVASLKARDPILDHWNARFGLDYWSNRVGRWEDFPSTDGAVNQSLKEEMETYRRSIVTDFLAWQAGIVRTLKRPDQCLTHNFDQDWFQGSYGVQPQVDHFAASRAFDIAGVDIYHPGQDKLDGSYIAFGGDLARSMKRGANYLVLETQAQGFPNWTPYPGQLRLQAFSHLASGADMVEYWHWGSTTNGPETYWRGLLSQDYSANATYREAQTIGGEFARLSPQLLHLKKRNRVAVYFSNRALTAFNAFGIYDDGKTTTYNQVLRPFYDALYRMNVEVDLVDPSVTDLSAYKLIVVPALYAASDAELARLNAFARAGGHVVYGFKSGFSNADGKVRSTAQPGGIADAVGATYSQYTIPHDVTLRGDPFHVGAKDNAVTIWMELLSPTTAETLATYDHPVWGHYAAVTRNRFGAGLVTYVGFMPTPPLLEKVLEGAVRDAGLWDAPQSLHFPVVVRSGTTADGRTLHYVLNYSAQSQSFAYPFPSGRDLLTGSPVAAGRKASLDPWGLMIVESS